MLASVRPGKPDVRLASTLDTLLKDQEPIEQELQVGQWLYCQTQQGVYRLQALAWHPKTNILVLRVEQVKPPSKH